MKEITEESASVGLLLATAVNRLPSCNLSWELKSKSTCEITWQRPSREKRWRQRTKWGNLFSSLYPPFKKIWNNYLLFPRYLWSGVELFRRLLLLHESEMYKLDHSIVKMPRRKFSPGWCQKQWRKRIYSESTQWRKILAGIQWQINREWLHLGRSRTWKLHSLGQESTKQLQGRRLCARTWCGVQLWMEWREVQRLSPVYL